MLIANQMPRIFLMKEKGNDISLADPDAKWSIDAVLQFYANTYPILTCILNTTTWTKAVALSIRGL